MMLRCLRPFVLAAALVGVVVLGAARTSAQSRSFLNGLGTTPAISASTMPANGDQNPYGVAVVPNGFPYGATVHPGDILVSNFNNGANVQGTGTTIVAVTPRGTVSTFFSAPASLGPVGLTTALVALRSGIVVVGNTPASNNAAQPVLQGSLVFLDSRGRVLLNLVDARLQGPWDMTADESDPDRPILYVANVRNGTVTRIDMHIDAYRGQATPRVDRLTVIASGFAHRPDPNALVVGPTGLLLDRDHDALYVADTGNNRVQLIATARERGRDDGPGRTVVSGAPLKGPLALAFSPVGTIVASNGDAAGDAATPPNMVVEFDPQSGRFVATRQLDSSGVPGAIFGIAIARVNGRSALLYVNDNTTTLNVQP